MAVPYENTKKAVKDCEKIFKELETALLLMERELNPTLSFARDEWGAPLPQEDLDYAVRLLSKTKQTLKICTDLKIQLQAKIPKGL